MKVTKKTSLFFSALLTLLLGAALCFGIAAGAPTAAAEEWSDVSIAASYPLGTEFSAPLRTVTVAGETVEATSSLVYPDGTATLRDPCILDQAGTYTVRYAAKVGGAPYADEVTFYVGNNILSYGAQTTVEYGTPAGTLTDGSPLATSEGMLVHLAQGDTLTFMQSIDVAELTQYNRLLECFVYPTTLGVADMDAIVFTLTDSQDPDIYVTIRGHRYIRCPGVVYFSAGGNGQPLKGDESGNVHVNDEWGMPLASSFEAKRYNWGTGETQDEASDRYTIRLSFDAQSMGVFGECGSGAYGGQIIDLDDPNYFDSLWGGFPSGKVFLSVRGENYNSPSANICFKSVLGTDVTAFEGALTDEDPPQIAIENPYDAAAMPEARVGGSYPVFAATAQDIYAGACEVEVSVWYDYASGSAVRIPVEEGRFATARAGWYAIVYRADDGFGNVAEETIWVHAGRSIEEMRFGIPAEGLTADVGTYVSVPSVGSVVEAGGSGAVTVTAVVSHGGEEQEIADGFFATAAGEWKVTYRAVDLTGYVQTASFTVTVLPSDEPVLSEQPVVPQLFISGAPYTLAEAYADDYSSGSREQVRMQVCVTDANGEAVYETGETFVPAAAQNGDTVRLAYLCRGIVMAEYEIPAVLAFVREDGTSRLHVENYFYGTGVQSEKTASGILLSAASGAESMEWTFANALAAELALDVRSVPGSASFAGLRITLTDAEDPSVSVSAQLVQRGSRSAFTAGGSSLDLDRSFTASSSQQFSIGFEKDAFLLGNVRFPVSQTDRGASFTGFASGKVWLHVEMYGVVGSAAYRVVSLNSYPFTESTRDLVAPNIVLLEDYGGSYERGASYTIGAAVASDVLSPAVTFGLTVRDPEGNVVTDVDGTLLENVDPSAEYTIALEKFGQYQVVYTAAESSEFIARPNETTFRYAVNVEDGVAPVFTFDGELVQTAKVGDVITLPDYTVTDNVTPAEEIVVTQYVLTPHGMLVALQGNAFRPAYEGVYEFRLVATDGYGNMQMVRLQVRVTAA